MTDRELLELAAKAAGINIFDWTPGGQPTTNGKYTGIWNPITDDGDALRLAVDLRMEIDHNHAADQVLWVSVRAAGQRPCSIEEFEDDEHRRSATRRAITRAAADIGRSMP